MARDKELEKIQIVVSKLASRWLTPVSNPAEMDDAIDAATKLLSRTQDRLYRKENGNISLRNIAR